MSKNPSSDAHRVVVFHDGGCPLCRREIGHYQRLDARHGAGIDWRDIHREPDALDAWGIDWQTAMQRMHVVDAEGQVQTGAWAFVAMWQALPYYRVPARILGRVPGLLRLMDAAYRVFARRRWKRRCADGVCGVPESTERPTNPPASRDPG